MREGTPRPEGAIAGSTDARQNLVDLLPSWRLLAGIDTVQALTLPAPAVSESARALVRFVKEALRGR